MTKSLRQLIALVAGAAVLCVPAAAWASPGAVIGDCASDGSLDGTYSDADKRAALGQLGAELQEYSDCRSVIAAAIGGGGAAGGASNSSDGAGGGAAGKSRKRRADRAKDNGKGRGRNATEIALDSRAIESGDPAELTSEDTANGISTPVLLALIALGLMGAAGALFALGRRSPRVADVFRRVSFARFRR